MASKLLDGFGGIAVADLPLRGYIQSATNPVPSIVAGRYATSKALQFLNGIDRYFDMALPVFSGGLVLGLSNYVSALTSGDMHRTYYSLRAAGGALVCGFGSDNTGRAYLTFDGTTFVTASSATVVANQWQNFELKYVAGGTTYLQMNGVTVVSAMAPAGTPVTLRLGVNAEAGANDITQRVGDLRIFDTTGPDNNDVVGDTFIVNRYMTSDRPGNDWSASAGTTHFNLINEPVEDGDATYVESTTVNATERYVSNETFGSPLNIYAVGIQVFAKKTDGAIRRIALQLDNNGMSVTAPPITLSTSYAGYSAVFDRNPNSGGVPWAIPGVINTRPGLIVIE